MTSWTHGTPKLLRDVAEALSEGERHARPELVEQTIRTIVDGSVVDRFIEEAAQAGMSVSRCDRDGLEVHIRQLIEERSQTGPVLIEPALASEYPELARAIGATSRPTEDELYAAGVGLVTAQHGIAETGSCVRSASPARPRSFALVPPLVVLMLNEGDILPDLWDWLALQDPQAMPAETVIITGPSKTADIGMKLVTGIHGPGEVHVVLLA